MIYEAHVGKVYERYEGTPKEINELLRLKEEPEEKKVTHETAITIMDSNGEPETIKLSTPKLQGMF